MRDILTITGPIYLSIALGYVATRSGLFVKSDLRTLGKFVVNLAIPALLFNAIARRNAADLLHGDYMLAYAAGSLGLLGLGWCTYRYALHMRASHSAVAVMGMVCSNSGFVGYPIIWALAERGRGHAIGWRAIVTDTVGRLARNPLVLGVFAALAFSMLSIPLPDAAWRTIELFALASTAMALFVVGGSLVGLPLRGVARQVLPIAFGKLVLHPLAVFLAALSLAYVGLPAMEPKLFQAAVLMAAMPMTGVYPVLAQVYGLDDLSAAALLFTTVASFFTINALLWMVRSGWVQP